jgi:hypothetical protein
MPCEISTSPLSKILKMLRRYLNQLLLRKLPVKLYHKLKSKLLGRNTSSTPVAVIQDQMLEPRPLPLGRAEFDIWAERIISGALLDADKESMRFSLANMLLHLGPTESHKPDAFFIHSLRKFAVNQVADAVAREIRDATKARLAKEEQEKLKADAEAKALADAAALEQVQAAAEATTQRIQAMGK